MTSPERNKNKVDRMINSYSTEKQRRLDTFRFYKNEIENKDREIAYLSFFMAILIIYSSVLTLCFALALLS